MLLIRDNVSPQEQMLINIVHGCAYTTSHEAHEMAELMTDPCASAYAEIADLAYAARRQYHWQEDTHHADSISR